MQDRRIGGDQLLPLEAVDVEHRGLPPVEFIQAAFDRIQPPNGASVIVLVVARQKPLREPVKARGLEI
jgi:hypothetical protein